MPDLEKIIYNYLDLNCKLNYQETFKIFELTFIETRAELINIDFRWWGHKHLYDYEELERRLKEVGFEKIKRCNIYNSDYNELKNLETKKESDLIAEVIK